MRENFRKIILWLIFPRYILFYISYLLCDGEVRRCVQLDAKGDSWISIMYKLHWDDYFKTIFLYRVRKVKLSRVITNRNKRIFFIPYDVVIGENLIYDHPYSTILNAKSIGRNFKFKHLVTIGNVGDNEDLRPTIGNDVTMCLYSSSYPGCSLRCMIQGWSFCAVKSTQYCCPLSACM